MDSQIILTIIAPIITATGAYMIAKRKTSGSISTSEAATLWKESNELRQEYRKRAEQLEERLEEVNKKLQSVMEELGKLRLNSANMIEKITELKRIIEELRQENKRLLELKGELQNG